jgi:hypothetical protein
MTEAVASSEMSVDKDQITRRHIKKQLNFAIVKILQLSCDVTILASFH